MRLKKVVFDTNIYVSAILFGGNPRQCLELAKEHKFELFVSRAILLELAIAMNKKFSWNKEEIAELVKSIGVFAKIVIPQIKIDAIEESPKDNRILECALAVQAHYIVSGDKRHLLSLKKIKNTPIISAKQFLDLIYETIS